MPRYANEETAEVTAVFITETDDAYCIEVEPVGARKAKRIWLPKSQCERVRPDTWEVALWLAEKERLV